MHLCGVVVLFNRVFPSTWWSVTRHPSVPQAEKGSEWPENGGHWSDEDGANMDCGLLQAMAEEDEEINVYNEETFGMGVCLKWPMDLPFAGCFCCMAFIFGMRRPQNAAHGPMLVDEKNYWHNYSPNLLKSNNFMNKADLKMKAVTDYLQRGLKNLRWTEIQQVCVNPSVFYKYMAGRF